MALRIGQLGPLEKVTLYRVWRKPGWVRQTPDREVRGNPSRCVELSTQNWSGQGESDSLIKTKHCDGLKR